MFLTLHYGKFYSQERLTHAQSSIQYDVFKLFHREDFFLSALKILLADFRISQAYSL